MHYVGNIIRPPSEANSILLQVTVGCSHNRCTFCGAYKGRRFQIKNDEIIDSDLEFAAQHCRQLNRLFLCDGDAMIIPQERLLSILVRIEKKLPWVNRIGIYANAKSLKRKSLQELLELKAHGLGIIYLGLESGDDLTLKQVRKYATARDMIEQGTKVKKAGIKLSVTVLLGIAGEKRSQQHARATGNVLSAIDPDYVGALSVMLLPNTPLFEDWRQRRFLLPPPLSLLQELKLMLQHTHMTRGLFFANHASNYLPIKVRMPKDKEAAIQLIDAALVGNVALKPEWLRGL